VGGVKRFQDLIAWQRAMSLVKETYTATSFLPDTERFGLSSQMRRCAISIPSNVAEGFGRESTTDLLRFLRTARGSLFELQTQFLVAADLQYLHPDQVPSALLDECDRVLQGLIRSLETRQS
jgi:four helix bundle protein